jgi:hypothetical protein
MLGCCHRLLSLANLEVQDYDTLVVTARVNFMGRGYFGGPRTSERGEMRIFCCLGGIVLGPILISTA